MVKEKDIALFVVAVLVFIVNAIELKLLFRGLRKLSVFEKLLLSMAFADILVGIIQALVSTLRMAGVKVPGIGSTTVLLFTIAASFDHVNAITIDRFLAVYWPIKHRIWVTNKIVIITIIILWVFNAFAFIPLFVDDSMDYIRYIVALVAIIYMGLMMIIYPIIIYKAVICRRRSLQCQNATAKDHEKSDFQLVIISLCIVVTFVACTMPFCVSAFISEDIPWPVMSLAILNSFFNPFIYFFWKLRERNSRGRQSTSTQ